MRLGELPLCSHLPTAALFRTELLGAEGCVAYPLKAQQKVYVPSVSGKHQVRLQDAEAYLNGELRRQQALVRELQNLCGLGLFLPVLHSSVVPKCNTGIALKSERWAQKLQQVLLDTMEMLMQPLNQLFVPSEGLGHELYPDHHLGGDEEEDDEEDGVEGHQGDEADVSL